MREAWETGVILAGLSAGAMCWFEGGISMSAGRPEPVPGLGLLTGSLSVHRSSEPWRLPVYLQAVADGQLPEGYAADDGTALLFAGHELVECVASRPGRGVVRVELRGGQPTQLPMPIRLLETAPEHSAIGWSRTPGAESDRQAIEELRRIRAIPRGWA